VSRVAASVRRCGGWVWREGLSTSRSALRSRRRDNEFASAIWRLVVERRSLHFALRAPVETTGERVRFSDLAAPLRASRSSRDDGKSSSSRPRPGGPRGETLLQRSGGWLLRGGLSTSRFALRSRRRDNEFASAIWRLRFALRVSVETTEKVRRLDQGPEGRAERPRFDDPAAGR
jgi:hypothetical protein